MHVLLIPSWYPENASDVNGSFFREQAIALVNQGVRVGVIAPSLQSLRSPKLFFSGNFSVNYENDQGVDTYRRSVINIFPRMPILREWLWGRLGLSLYKCYIEEHGVPDIIHVHSMLDAGMLAREIKSKYSIPYVITEHSSAFSKKKFSDRQIRGFNDIAKNASFRFAVSTPFCALLSEKFGEAAGEWLPLPNIVKNYFFLKDRRPKKSSDDFVFINICFLTENKQVDLLLNAFSMAFKGISNVRLKIGGGGPERDRLISLAESLNISEQVEFLGMLSREEVGDSISESNVFVLSSRYETFGVVVIESLALGKPVIATRCGGPEEIIREENGILVPKDDINSLSRAMICMKKNIKKYDPDKIKKDCQNKYSEQVISQKLIGYYQEALSRLEFGSTHES